MCNDQQVNTADLLFIDVLFIVNPRFHRPRDDHYIHLCLEMPIENTLFLQLKMQLCWQKPHSRIRQPVAEVTKHKT